MRSGPRLLACATLTAAAVLCVGAAQSAQTNQTAPQTPPPAVAAEKPLEQIVISRAAVRPSETIVRAVATLSRPTRLAVADAPDLGEMTGRQVIERLCGSVQDGYVEVLRAQHPAIAFELDAPLGARGYEIAWPGCLFVAHGGAGTYTIRRGDTPADIRRLFTGTSGTPAEANAFVAAGANARFPAGRLPVGLTLRPTFRSLPTQLEPRSGTAADFARELTRVGGDAVAAAEQEVGGEIILPSEVASVKDEAGNPLPQCEAGTDDSYPFEPEAVAIAYQHARRSVANDLGFGRQNVHLVIVDNGFFGVPCLEGNCPEMRSGEPIFSDRFPRPYFDTVRFPLGVLGPTLLGPRNHPINYLNELRTANTVSGHGTHVAGLAIGGPRFMPHRSIFSYDDGGVWLKLVIANLAAGSRTFAAGTEQSIISLVNGIDVRKIVNLSLVIDGSTATRREAADRLRDLLSNNRNSLFVAAAGNNGRDLAQLRYYPARHGGTDGVLNLLTVASVDGNGHLSRFSNHSGTYVDIAAPGCQIQSWLNAESDPVAVSGTSQAAPIVSFAAAMLRSFWDMPPPRLKTRLLYSGSLLSQPGDRQRVASQTSLNIVHALLVRSDIVTFVRNGERRVLLGKIDAPLQGLRCEGQTADVNPDDLRSFKQEHGATLLFRRVSNEAQLEICPARVQARFGNAPNELAFTPTHELRVGRIGPLGEGATDPIPVESIRDIVWREPDRER